MLRLDGAPKLVATTLPLRRRPAPARSAAPSGEGRRFPRAQITVRDGKGAKDRVTIKLLAAIRESLIAHLSQPCASSSADLAAGFGSVLMPYALDRKYPGAAKEWGWQCVFPAALSRQDPPLARASASPPARSVIRKR